MAKIFSILTLLAAGLALYLGLESGKRIKEMQAAGLKTQSALSRTEGTLKTTQETLKTTEEKLVQTTTDLESTRAKLATAEQELTKAKADLTTATAEIDKSKAEMASIKKQLEEYFPGVPFEEGLKGLFAKVKELGDAKTAAEAKAADLEKIRVELDTTVKTLEQAKKEADERIATQGTTIKRYSDNIMQKGIRGRVMAVNSGWGFCVLSVGDRQGAAANKVMIVARGGQAIGKVRITNVEATQSVADILPGTFVRGTYVQPGDDVIYTGDDKVKIEEEAPASTPASAPTSSTSPVSQPPLPQ
jgi:hypothetical protein